MKFLASSFLISAFVFNHIQNAFFDLLFFGSFKYGILRVAICNQNLYHYCTITDYQ